MKQVQVNPIVPSASVGQLGGVVSSRGVGPLGGVTVTVRNGEFEVEAVTPTIGATGAYRFIGLQTPATYIVTFALEGYTSQTVALEIGPGKTVDLNVTLIGGLGQIDGTVTDPGFNPLGAVTVLVEGNGFNAATATLTDPGATGGVGSFFINENQTRILTLELARWGALFLLVVLMLELKDKLLAKDEIQVARQVQLALLPRTHPELPGWSLWSYSRPANDVGGDLVDYLDLDGFRHGVLLGDVAGKGLGAALLSSKLQATLRALVPQALSLEDLCTQVNTIFYRDGLPNRYATLFYAELQYDSGSVRYVNAGHNPALAIRRDSVERLGASGLPLGMLEGSGYEEASLNLDPGEMLFIYSDGVTEAENIDSEEFGIERLEALTPQLRKLDPESAGHLVLTEIDLFLDGLRPADDLSMVIVKRHDDA